MDIISELTDKNDEKAYALTKKIAEESKQSNKYYCYLDDFASLLSDSKSYVRTRAFISCCSQAKWDTDNRLKTLLPVMLKLFHDSKPTVVRQCLNAVRELVIHKPELKETVNDELDRINLSDYKESMSKLIDTDVKELRKLIEETKI